MADIGADRRWVVEEFNAQFGRNPSQQELDGWTAVLQQGHARDVISLSIQQNYPQERIRYLYKSILRREPEQFEYDYWVPRLQNREFTPAQLTQIWSDQPEALLYESPPATDTSGQEDAIALINRRLADWGLSGTGLPQWAWDELVAGTSPERIFDALRDRPEYKQRFAGMEGLKNKGYNAINEQDYLNYETRAREMMRAAGVMPGMFDSQEELARLIGGGVSLLELQTRLNEVIAEAMDAPAEIRQQLQSLYNVGPGQIVSYFLDETKALPLIQRQFAAAQASGTAVRAGFGALAQTEAERLADLDVSVEEAEEGFGYLVDADELWRTLPGEDSDPITRAEQMGAVFAADAEARRKIRTRQGERVSAGSGAQSFALGQRGIAGLGTERRS